MTAGIKELFDRCNICIAEAIVLKKYSKNFAIFPVVSYPRWRLAAILKISND